MGSDSTSATEIMMVPWLHFDGGDNLFFKSLHPSSGGALAGASIVLFLLAIFERWLSAIRVKMEAQWRERALGAVKPCSKAAVAPTSTHTRPTTTSDAVTTDTRTTVDGSEKVGSPTPLIRRPRMFAPFIPSNDLARGAVHALQTTLGYTLMLAVMTFQAGYIIAIIVGAGAGEILFGRMKAGAAYHH